MLSHAANFYLDRFLSYSFLATGYSTPAPEGYDVDGIIAYTKQLFGYSTIGYFKFFNVSEAGPIIDKHQLSFAELLYHKMARYGRSGLVPSVLQEPGSAPTRWVLMRTISLVR